MRMLVLLWMACDAGAYAQVKPAIDGPTYAVVRLEHSTEECSNLGGAHYSFAVDEPGVPRMLHAGGHGKLNLHLANDTYYVAEVTVKDRPDPTSNNAGWCLRGLPAYSGEVLRFVPARNLADARAQLVTIQRDGWPAGQILDHTPMVVTMTSTSSSCMNRWFVDFTFTIEEHGVARAVQARSSRLEVATPLEKKFRESQQATYFVADVSPAKVGDLAGICGDVPAYIGTVDKLVPASSLADAQHRLATIERDGWPAAAYTFGF